MDGLHHRPFPAWCREWWSDIRLARRQNWPCPGHGRQHPDLLHFHRHLRLRRRSMATWPHALYRRPGHGRRMVAWRGVSHGVLARKQAPFARRCNRCRLQLRLCLDWSRHLDFSRSARLLALGPPGGHDSRHSGTSHFLLRPRIQALEKCRQAAHRPSASGSLRAQPLEDHPPRHLLCLRRPHRYPGAPSNGSHSGPTKWSAQNSRA